jgi:hypothetical protein
MKSVFNKLVYTPATNTRGIEVFCDIRIADESGAPLHCIGTVSENINPFDNLPEFTLNDARRYAILFASAPELLEALKRLVDLHVATYGLDGAWDEELNNAQKAIAKAEAK